MLLILQQGLKQKYGGANKVIEITFKEVLSQSFVDLLKKIIIGSETSDGDQRRKGNTTNTTSHIDINETNLSAITITVNNAEEVISEISQFRF